MQAGLDGAFGDADDGGYLRYAEVFLKTEGEEEALVGWKFGKFGLQGAVEGLTVYLHVEGVVLSLLLSVLDFLLVGLFVGEVAIAVLAEVVGDAEEPGGEGRPLRPPSPALPEGRGRYRVRCVSFAVGPDAEEGVLREVGSEGFVMVQLAEEEAHEATGMTTIELVVSPFVVLAGDTRHQLLVGERTYGFEK